MKIKRFFLLFFSIFFLLYLILDYFNIPYLLGVRLKNINYDLFGIIVHSVVVIVLYGITYFEIDKKQMKKEENAQKVGYGLMLRTYAKCSTILNVLNDSSKQIGPWSGFGWLSHTAPLHPPGKKMSRWNASHRHHSDFIPHESRCWAGLLRGTIIRHELRCWAGLLRGTIIRHESRCWAGLLRGTIIQHESKYYEEPLRGTIIRHELRCF